jgi:hypothetical protein
MSNTPARASDGEAPEFDDEPFDVSEVLSGAWWPTRYGADDEVGTFNEVTPEKTRQALSLLDLTRPVRTYNLGETLFNGFPALAGRTYEQRLQILGFEPPAGFDGITAATEPFGENLVSSLEERVSFTYNMGTKINGLHHVGINGIFYNGLAGKDICQGWGTTHLGMDRQPAIVTRGIVIDVVGYKVAHGPESDYEILSNGQPCLPEGYRITTADIEAALAWELITEPIGPGDVALIRTGWRHHIALDPARYIDGYLPGIGLREARWLASKRPAIVGIDVWYFTTRSHSGLQEMLAHQELPMRYGVRVGESVMVEELVADRVYEFVFCWNPLRARGAVSSPAPPTGLGQPPE